MTKAYSWVAVAVFVHQIIRLRLCSHGTGPKWILPYPGKDHFCSHGTVPLINVRPHGTGLLWFGTESKKEKQLVLPVKHVQNTR